VAIDLLRNDRVLVRGLVADRDEPDAVS